MLLLFKTSKNPVEVLGCKYVPTTSSVLSPITTGAVLEVLAAWIVLVVITSPTFVPINLG